MKKILYFLPLLFLPIFAFAQTVDFSTYTAPATVNYTGFTNGYEYDLYLNPANEPICSSDRTGWTSGSTGDLAAASWNGVNNCFNPYVSTIGNYVIIQTTVVPCGSNGHLNLAACKAANPGYTEIDFSITSGAPPAPVGMVISAPTGTVSGLTAALTAQVSDLGTLKLIILAISIPLFFYLVKEMLALFKETREYDRKHPGHPFEPW